MQGDVKTVCAGWNSLALTGLSAASRRALMDMVLPRLTTAPELEIAVQ